MRHRLQSLLELAKEIPTSKSRARAQDRGRRPWQWELRLRSEGAGRGRAGARATVAAPVAASDIEDVGHARTPHGRWQALHCDCGAEDASRRIGTRRVAVSFPAVR